MMATMSAYSTAVTPASRTCCPPRRARTCAYVAERYPSTRTGPLRFLYRSVLLDTVGSHAGGGLNARPAGLTNLATCQVPAGQTSAVGSPTTQSPVLSNAVDTFSNRRKNPA